jgi:hypothetical protein
VQDASWYDAAVAEPSVLPDAVDAAATHFAVPAATDGWSLTMAHMMQQQQQGQAELVTEQLWRLGPPAAQVAAVGVAAAAAAVGVAAAGGGGGAAAAADDDDFE